MKLQCIHSSRCQTIDEHYSYRVQALPEKGEPEIFYWVHLAHKPQGVSPGQTGDRLGPFACTDTMEKVELLMNMQIAYSFILSYTVKIAKKKRLLVFFGDGLVSFYAT